MKRTLLLTLLTILFPILAFAQGARYDNIALQNSGGFAKVVPNASVKVCFDTACVSPAPIFSNIALTNTLSNPTQADINGNFFFYITPGTYTLQVSGVGVQTLLLTNMTIPCVVGANCAASTVFPTTVITFATSPSFAVPTAQGVAYQMTLTGNVVGSSITGTPIDGMLMSFHLIQSGGPWTFAWPPSFQNPPTIQTTGATDATFKFIGPLGVWAQLIFPASGTGGGLTNPMTNAGDMIAGAGGGTPARVAVGITGQIPVENSGTVSFQSQGLPGNVVTTTPYTISCDNGTTTNDRSKTVILKAGASVITVPDPTTSGCGNFMAFAIIDDGAGAITVNRTTTATFDVNNGSTTSTAQTTFPMGNGQMAAINSPDNTNWMVRLYIGASSGCSPGAFTAQTDGATVTWAIGGASCVNASLTFTVHGGSRTLNLTGLVAGGSYILKLIQDATGGENLTGGTGCTWKQRSGGGATFTLTNAANATDILAFTYDGTNCLANLGPNYN